MEPAGGRERVELAGGMQQLMAMRMVSIAIKNLDTLMRELVTELRNEKISEPPGGYTSEHLKAYFVMKQIYPPLKYLDRNYFSSEKPDISVTYMWPTVPIEKIAEILKQRYDENHTTYLDIVLNDQRTPATIDFALQRALLRCFACVQTTL